MKDFCMGRREGFKKLPALWSEGYFYHDILMTSAGVYKYTVVACDLEAKHNRLQHFT